MSFSSSLTNDPVGSWQSLDSLWDVQIGGDLDQPARHRVGVDSIDMRKGQEFRVAGVV